MKHHRARRLHHPLLRSTTFTVEDVLRPLKAPTPCMPCSLHAGRDPVREPIMHHVKTYHLDLDSEGDVIVSTQVFDALKRIPGLAGLKLLNSLEKGPDQVVGMNGAGPRFGNYHVTNHEFN